MIIIITGGIGSGKTLSLVKEIIDRNQKTFTNFKLYNTEYYRLKEQNILMKDPDDKKKLKVNFDFWKSQKKESGFDIYLDEFHNLMNARRGMSKRNVVLSDWLSQIRKILGDSELHNLYLISQKLRRIDVNSRDLCEKAITCHKVQYPDVLIATEIVQNNKIVIKNLPLTMIYKYEFKSAESLGNFENYGIGKPKMSRFVGNWYYKYYDSFELVEFGGDDYI